MGFGGRTLWNHTQQKLHIKVEFPEEVAFLIRKQNVTLENFLQDNINGFYPFAGRIEESMKHAG